MSRYDTPILLIIFNRPEKVEALMSVLSSIKPKKLYIAADGPRRDHPTDIEKCKQARDIATNLTWAGEVYTNFSDVNLGVDPAVERGIGWFFENEEAGIILEDDCLPHPDFFPFITELLERYRNDDTVMMISGNNFQDNQKHGVGSYYFSQYPNTWGWATWKRAWQHFDTNLTSLPQFIERKGIEGIRPLKKEQRYWLRYFKSLYSGHRTAWDAKWLFSIWKDNGLSITPNVNLVSNIGFGADATHTKSAIHMSKDTHGLSWPLSHPSSNIVSIDADSYLFRKLYFVTFWKRVWYKIKGV